jgi:hypothetical protein
MTQAEIEAELQAVSSQLKQMVDQDQSRETEWRRLGLLAKISGVISSLTGAGFTVGNRLFPAENANFHDQMTMMGIMFIVVSTPLILLGQALRRGPRSSLIVRTGKRNST